MMPCHTGAPEPEPELDAVHDAVVREIEKMEVHVQKLRTPARGQPSDPTGADEPALRAEEISRVETEALSLRQSLRKIKELARMREPKELAQGAELPYGQADPVWTPSGPGLDPVLSFYCDIT